MVEVDVQPFTLLIGENNSGKTSFLEAIAAAIGLPRRPILEEDIYVGEEESSPPKSRKCQIDLLFRPVSTDGLIADSFPEGSPWTTLWGPAISQDAEDNDFLAIRTEAAWNVVKAEYETARYFLTSWPAKVEEMDQAKQRAGGISAAQLEAVGLYLMDAKRDIDDDLRRQGSFWRRLTSDLGISDADVTAFESALAGLNAEILEKSDVLKHVKTHLDSIDNMVSASAGSIELAAVAPRLRDIAKGIEINFATEGAQKFSLSKHGMGTRSLATLLVFRAFAAWRIASAKGQAVHPLLALEEPEAHLHPQAQRAAFDKISDIPGQLIVSTHSPYFVSRARLDSLRRFAKEGTSTKVRRLDLKTLVEDDIRRIERAVVISRGDVLFARKVVLIEGETEDVALPIWAEAYWASTINDLGFAFVSVGGSGSFLPYLRAFEQLEIPYFVLCDGDSGLANVIKAFKKAGINAIDQAKKLVQLPPGDDIESYLLTNGYDKEVRAAIDKVNGNPADFDNWMKSMHGQPHETKIVRDYQSLGAEKRAMYDLLTGAKTKFAKAIASEISAIPDPARSTPPAIRELLDKVLPPKGTAAK
ncbi:MAG: AAA family ATPase [Burkholderiales bacterium]|nr:AAA family ATPase [Burkholderiales bacterium]